ncbi:MAG: RNA polymerase sigma factor, partial [Gemmatimonadales bacterium]
MQTHATRLRADVLVRRPRAAAPGLRRVAVTPLVGRAQAGDHAAFHALYREHVGRVYALCLRWSADSTRADELTQDVFVRAWEHLGSFRGDSAFSTWLHRLAVNTMLMDRRAVGRREGRVIGVADVDAGGRDPAPGLGIDLERAIGGLPEGAREVFLLYDVEGYRHAEIATLLGIAEGTSKAQLF